MKLMDQVQAGSLVLKNRLVMPPMATAKATAEGFVTDELVKYYEEKTASQLFSAVIIEHSFVDPRGKAHARQTSMAEDGAIPGMKRIAAAIHGNGALAIAQISHAGSSAKESVIGQKPVSASSVENPAAKTGEVPETLTVAEIQEIKAKFVAAAKRVKEAGFDAVELHSAHAYLLDQFLSPITNHREDAYGGDIHGRIRLHLEIIAGIREAVGTEFPIFLRMGAGDFREGGLTIDDAVVAAKAFEEAGVTLLDISGGMCFYTIPDTRPGYFDVLSEPIRKALHIPVMLTGGVKKGTDVVDILDRDVCDLVGIGRAVFANSEWMEQEIRPLL